TEFAGRQGEAWKLHVAAPPVDGKANQAIQRFLATLLKVPAAAIRIVSGFSSPLKIVEVDGIDSARLQRVILESNGNPAHSGISPPAED
ncbi:MAG TPA: DUF167 domain-containing protein, partial [Bryobacteraceae bacterium]|nr:DUF167 domain-containing protein [Bryobacteraceae bacterium]